MSATALIGLMAATAGAADWEELARQAVRRGMEWLAARQRETGAWSCRIGHKLYFGYEGPEGDHVGVTALACLAFMAGGHTPGRGTYGPNVERGLRFTLSCAREDGYITHAGSRMYSHAYATLFLADVYGMTSDPQVHPRLRTAVDLIVRAQSPEGGWRYAPDGRDADLSVTVSTLQALRAARNAGIHVPVDTIERAMHYVRGCAAPQGRGTAGFTYQRPRGPGDPVDERISFPLTACGVVSMFSAADYDSPIARNALGALQRMLYRSDGGGYGYSEPHPMTPNHYFFYYGHFYAAQAFYVAGGDHWASYRPRIVRVILDAQAPDGSWDDAVHSQPGVGPTFATAMALLILQTPNEYLPIFQR